MAFTDIAPGTITVNMTQGQGQAFQSSQVNQLGTNTAQDLSAWVSLVAKMVPPTPLPYGADSSFGTVTANSSGIVTLTTDESDLASVPPGTAQIKIYGKPTSGDISQLIASGTLTVAAG